MNGDRKYMRKINPQLKNEYTLTMQDEINAIRTIADMFFVDIKDDEGNIVGIEYTPYYEKIGQVKAIARFLINGIEFEKDEDIYDAVINEKDVRPLIDMVLLPYDKDFKNITYQQKIFADIMDKVYDIVSYRKAVNIAKIQKESN